GDAFALCAGGARLTHRAQAGERLKTLAERALLSQAPGSVTDVATLGGLTLAAATGHGSDVALAFAGVPGDEIRMTLTELRDCDPAGLISRLERRLTGLDQRREDTLTTAAQWRAEAQAATEQLGKPFPHAAQLATARARAHDLEEAMRSLATPEQPSTAETGDTPATQPANRPAPAAQRASGTPRTHRTAPTGPDSLAPAIPATAPAEPLRSHSQTR
ncbi:MAG: hypothetical protein ACRDKL_07775, partial [Solirubrobacteraceae bacterium]